MSANEVEFLGLEHAAKLTNRMGGNSDESGSLMEKHWLGKLKKRYFLTWGGDKLLTLNTNSVKYYNV